MTAIVYVDIIPLGNLRDICTELLQGVQYKPVVLYYCSNEQKNDLEVNFDAN